MTQLPWQPGRSLRVPDPDATLARKSADKHSSLSLDEIGEVGVQDQPCSGCERGSQGDLVQAFRGVRPSRRMRASTRWFL